MKNVFEDWFKRFVSFFLYFSASMLIDKGLYLTIGILSMILLGLTIQRSMFE